MPYGILIPGQITNPKVKSLDSRPNDMAIPSPMLHLSYLSSLVRNYASRHICTPRYGFPPPVGPSREAQVPVGLAAASSTAQLLCPRSTTSYSLRQDMAQEALGP